MAPIVLYDLPSRFNPSICWSPNSWKGRLALNFKGLPYETQWTEYPDLAPTFKSHGVPPNEGGQAAYSSPTVRLEDGQFVMDSMKIAHELEKRYPEPKLHPDSPYVAKALENYSKLAPALGPVLLPQVPRKLLNPVSVEYFNRTRAQRFGMTLDEFEKANGGETAWQKAEIYIDDLAKLLKENPEGPFLLGNTPCFGDMIVAGFLQFMQLIDEQVYARFVAHDPVFVALHAASAKWLERKT